MAGGNGGGILPDDIVNEILLRLPSGIHIARCRCVCKSWRRLLSDPVFIHRILAHDDINSTSDDEFAQVLIKGDLRDGTSPGRPVYSLLSYKTLEPISASGKKPQFLPSVHNQVRPYYGELELSIVGCCDGIVCIADKLFASASDIILWDPTTSVTKILPSSPYSRHNGGGRLYAELIGFGIDPQTNDHKLIRCISAPMPADDFGVLYYTGWDVVEVYSLSLDSWKPLTFESASVSNPVRHPHTYRAEKLYWWGLNEGREDLYLKSFDVEREVFHSVNFANPTGKEGWVGHSFTLLKGSIVGVFSSCRVDPRAFEIWVLLKFDATVPWTKLFTSPSFDYVCRFPAIWKRGCYFLERGGSLFVYDPTTEETLDYGIEEDFMNEVEVVTFGPSKISLSDFQV